jgi:hypothetical protein
MFRYTITIVEFISPAKVTRTFITPRVNNFHVNVRDVTLEFPVKLEEPQFIKTKQNAMLFFAFLIKDNHLTRIYYHHLHRKDESNHIIGICSLLRTHY